MIQFTGTSTGALIAFGLVAGSKKSDGTRGVMKVNEVIEMYKTATPEIFKGKSVADWSKSWFTKKGWSSWPFVESGIRKWKGYPTQPYNQDGLKDQLLQFGAQSLLRSRNLYL